MLGVSKHRRGVQRVVADRCLVKWLFPKVGLMIDNRFGFDAKRGAAVVANKTVCAKTEIFSLRS